MLWRYASTELTCMAGGPGDIYLVFTNEGYEQASEILAKNLAGKDIRIAEFYRQGRRIIELQETGPRGMDSRVSKCFIAAEDNNFLSHFGIDFQGILRATLVNIQAGGIKEGASTITQQVARLRFLSQERSFLRKLREAYYAILLEIRYDKHEILELYLNEVHLGHGANGVQSAAKFYFDKSYFELSWGEAAVLSSLTTRPRDFSPLRNINRSRAKVQVTFQKLVENGEMTVAEAQREYQILEKDYYRTLNRSPLDSASNQRLNKHPYVTEYIRTKVLKYFSNRQLLTGGLRIYTTIVDEHQTAAEAEFIPYLKAQTKRRKRRPFTRYSVFDREFETVKQMNRLMFPGQEFKTRLTRNERDFLHEFLRVYKDDVDMLSYLNGSSDTNRTFEHYQSYGNQLVTEQQTVEGALISIRPVSGAITAVVGGSGFAPRNQLMRFETARRQPGSAFKPLVYSAGIDYSGRHPGEKFVLTASTLIDDAPVHFVNRDLTEYAPENYSHTYEGLMRLRPALVKSKNSVAVQVYRNSGPSAINPTAGKLLQLESRRRGPHKLPREAAVALGSFVVTPIEMAQAYAVFASQGREVHPYIITHITDAGGRILKDFRPKIKQRQHRQILSAAAAKIITSMLRDVVTRGTGRAAHLPGRQVAGKTGTTNRSTNAWFVGYTPNLVTALYIGYDKPASMGGGATGGGLAAPVWGRYMHKALRGIRPGHFDFGDQARVVSTTICARTGRLPGPGCGETLVEIFIPGTQPDDYEDPAADQSGGPIRAGYEEKVIKRKDDIFDEGDLP